NYRQSHQVPVDGEFCFLRLAAFCKMHLRQFSRVHGLAVDGELLFEYAKFSEPLRKLKSDSVAVSRGFQLDLDLESHRHVCAPPREVLWLDQVSYPVRASHDLLQDFERVRNRCLPRAVFPD